MSRERWIAAQEKTSQVSESDDRAFRALGFVAAMAVRDHATPNTKKLSLRTTKWMEEDDRTSWQAIASPRARV